jgi:hypothetical protein
MGIRLERMYDSETTTFVKTFITYITAPAPNVLAADVFGTGVFSLTSRAIKLVLASYTVPPFHFVFPHLLTPKVSRYEPGR